MLRRNGNDQLHISLYHALAGQAGVDARVFGAVNKVLFFVADFGQFIAARVDVDVAGAAAAHAAAVVLQLDAIVEGHVEHRLAGGRHVGLGRLAVAELKGDGSGGNRQNRERIRRKNTAFAAAKVLGPNPASKLRLNAGRELRIKGLPRRVRRQGCMVGSQSGSIVPDGGPGLHAEWWIDQRFIHGFAH